MDMLWTRALILCMHACCSLMFCVSHPPIDKQDALVLQELPDPYSTGSRLTQMRPEDSVGIFPTYSEADAMLNRKARAKKGMPLPLPRA